MGQSFGSRTRADDVLSDRRLDGVNMLVTGASAGIGFETARSLAGHGAHVLLACRTQDGAREAAGRIQQRHPQARLSEVALDLASFASVRQAVGQIGVERLDAIICNAGLFTTAYAETADGIERTVGVCHFGHFLLTSLLLPKLRAAAAARVVLVSSESHRHPAQLDFGRFPLERRHFRGLVAYGQAKLCNVLFANELTRRYASEGIVANSLHPGTLIRTSIFRSSGSAALLALAMAPFTKSIEQGAATSVYCAVAPELRGVGGRYFSSCREKPMSRGAQDVEAAATLWELSEQRVAMHV